MDQTMAEASPGGQSIDSGYECPASVSSSHCPPGSPWANGVNPNAPMSSVASSFQADDSPPMNSSSQVLMNPANSQHFSPTHGDQEDFLDQIMKSIDVNAFCNTLHTQNEEEDLFTSNLDLDTTLGPVSSQVQYHNQEVDKRG